MMRDRGDLRETLQNKARDLFALCDPEGKGYATKTDIEALRDEVPLPPNQLLQVFDALDANGDGKLTLHEFTDGFGIFLGIDALPQNNSDAQGGNETEDDDEMLEELLDHLGARNLFTDEEYVREMWSRVRKEDPVMRSNFEKFISKMAADLKESARERSNLQTTLKNRKEDHEAQVQSLYMEMEEQLRSEKERILEQERRKEQRLRDELEAELQLKDHQLKDLLEKHAQIESQLDELNSVDSEKKSENVKLQKDRDHLESRLAASERMLHEMKNQLSLLRKRSIEERRKRAQEINKQLLDEKDELALGTVQHMPKRVNSFKKNSQIERRADGNSTEIKLPIHMNHSDSEDQQNGSETPGKVRRTSLERTLADNHPLSETERYKNVHANRRPEDAVLSTSSGGSDMEDVDLDIQNNLNSPQREKSGRKYDPPSTSSDRYKSRANSTASVTSRKGLQQKIAKRKSGLEDAAPTRVFKVVFVGDSGTGKTSILQRFCTDTFKATFSATIGVDFQVKTIEVDGERIALQLWDTAGQERFRSMTHQYFRKADGIIIVYDVTSETTFRNVRNWMHNIQEGAQESVMVLLIGNKVDLCESETDRVVRTKDGVRLADEYGSLFFETSAKNGDSVCEAIEALASVLKTKEDEAMEHVLKLQEEEMEKRKRKCC
ncbi:EF-hand calcium-binding domain-containing protein 4B-like isoform X2 [Argiope bruennichi]|uniref:EF-hand calcium-binding domain-containing protein 4B-like isoform X2 n=1 Tax=Argiope bruennichi TaxID=94029 RepID=UPI002494A821|nr:EF-hand calcium-binding domain-containing protein 4B-like isoform X2 [Argiope bruennichi]